MSLVANPVYVKIEVRASRIDKTIAQDPIFRFFNIVASYPSPPPIPPLLIIITPLLIQVNIIKSTPPPNGFNPRPLLLLQSNTACTPM